MSGLLSSNLLSKKAISGKPVYDTNTYLYRLGDECVGLTGGWIVGYTSGTGSQSKTADHLQVSVDAGTAYRTYVITNMIDLTDATTLYVDANVTLAASDNGFCIGAYSNSNGASGSVAGVYVSTANSIRTIYSLDVSSLNSSYYVSVLARGGSSGTTAGIYRIWTE